MPRYKVVGEMPYYGRKPGEEFDAELPEAQEKRAIARGTLERLGGGPAPETPPAPPAPEPAANQANQAENKEE